MGRVLNLDLKSTLKSLQLLLPTSPTAPESRRKVFLISLKSGVGSQLWLIGLGMPLPSLEAHVYVAGN